MEDSEELSEVRAGGSEGIIEKVFQEPTNTPLPPTIVVVDGLVHEKQRIPRSTSSRRSGKKGSVHRKHSEKRKEKGQGGVPVRSEASSHPITGFEELYGENEMRMGLDLLNFRIFGGGGVVLYETVQANYCSLTLTGRNEIFIRKAHSTQVLLRIHSNAVEDGRYFHFYTGREKYLGCVSCDVKQKFKIGGKLENALTRESFTLVVRREGSQKIWTVMEDEKEEGGVIGRIETQSGHRWKSFYTLTFEGGRGQEESNRVLLLGLLLALASARLESELLPALLAISAFLLTFIIFFIIQFT